MKQPLSIPLVVAALILVSSVPTAAAGETFLHDLRVQLEQFQFFAQRHRVARAHLQARGVWANKPVPMFPYPGSPDYSKRWGAPDDEAWERALQYYLEQHDHFSDIQDDRPLPLERLELEPLCRAS